jgi:hypothetical protein
MFKILFFITNLLQNYTFLKNNLETIIFNEGIIQWNKSLILVILMIL